MIQEKEEHRREFKGVFVKSWIWLHEKLSWTEKCLLAEIDQLSSDVRGCYASNDYLAKMMRAAPGSVANMLSKLRAMGMIKDISFDGRRRYFKIVEPEPQEDGGFTDQGTSIHESVNPDITIRLSPIKRDSSRENREGRKDDESSPQLFQEKKEEKKVNTRFTPPTEEEVGDYLYEKELVPDKDVNREARKFMANHETTGWMIRGQKMKSWKAACVTWSENYRKFSAERQGSAANPGKIHNNAFKQPKP